MKLYQVIHQGGITDKDSKELIEYGSVVSFEDEKRANKAVKAGLIKEVHVYTFEEDKKEEVKESKEEPKKAETKKETKKKTAKKE